MDASLETAELGQVVILGFGRVGRMVADMLDAHDKDYLAIDSDVDARRRSAQGRLSTSLFGDVARPELLETPAAAQARAPSS